MAEFCRRHNECCGGADSMVLDGQYALTSVSDLCGGYTPSPDDDGWTGAAFDPESAYFWAPAYWRLEDGRWREIAAEEAPDLLRQLVEAGDIDCAREIGLALGVI